jgi:hypothetical protein
MTRKRIDIPLKTICAEHYLFDLEYSVEKVSEICGMDEESVREIYCNYKKYILPTRSTK